jgi:hypothetical protein
MGNSKASVAGVHHQRWRSVMDKKQTCRSLKYVTGMPKGNGTARAWAKRANRGEHSGTEGLVLRAGAVAKCKAQVKMTWMKFHMDSFFEGISMK